MNHRIRRQVLDLKLPREAGAVELQRQVGRVFQEKVLPKLDALFDQLAPADRFVRIERLEIDLGKIGEANWERHFVERCLEQIARQVTNATFEVSKSGETGTETLNPADHALAVFQHFLETGSLPWYAKDLRLSELEAMILEAIGKRESPFLKVILPLLRQKEAVLQRLVWQFSPAFSYAIVESALGLAPGWVTQAAHIRQSQTGQNLNTACRRDFLRVLLTSDAPAWRGLPPEAPLLAQLFSGIQPDTEPVRGENRRSKPETETPAAAKPKSPEPLWSVTPPKKRPQAATDGIFVDNAGAVLLAVYLPAFFSELKLTDGQNFATPEAQYRAVHLLHYLVTGREYPEEPVLVLPKILCGLDIEAPVPLKLYLREAEKTECTQLLEAVVRNWPALKNTGPDGLRSGFLQRMGQLSWSEGQSAWLLRVERVGQDLLLDRIPWSYSVVRLPWMEGMVMVEW